MQFLLSQFQVSYADTHPMFTARSFPHFFRVVPSENQFNQPRLAILKQFNWTRVGTLYQNEARYSLVGWKNTTRCHSPPLKDCLLVGELYHVIHCAHVSGTQ